MQYSSFPKKLSIPFANSGDKQNIPNNSQIGIDDGRASYDDGFPPLTRTPLSAGGKPPYGTDMNGVLFDITGSARWSAAGASYKYDSTFSSAIGGYPKSSILLNSTLNGTWLNTIENNQNNPEESLSGWVPLNYYGNTIVTVSGTSNVVLTPLQAASDTIIISGTVSSPINIIFPAWIKEWTVVNKTNGNYVACKTASGTVSSAVWARATSVIVGDGINVIQKNPAQRGESGGVFLGSSLFMVWGSSSAITNLPSSNGIYESSTVLVNPSFTNAGITYTPNNVLNVQLTPNDIIGSGLAESAWLNALGTNSFSYLCSSRQNGATLKTSWVAICN
ncbi:hypothetical protein ABQ333_22970 [Serratia fonticola]|uniref:hypothetical protein n=1 Tax=Serratia fonticola TaxID=47917 RepID=UPI003AAA4530